MTRLVQIPRYGAPDVLRVIEGADPSPGPGEVVVDVAACGVNFADTMARVGLYADAPKPPMVVGYEVAGTIASVGDGVDAGRVGERVMAGTQFGGYASRVAVPAGDAIPLADRLSFEQGAAIPVNYATAWAGLLGYGSLRPGEKVLIQAAGGGVGIAATQIAKRAGAEVWGTASPSKHDAIRANGVDHAVDYRSSGWWEGLPPFDLILDAIGGRQFRRSYAMLRAGGRLVAFGASSVHQGEKRNYAKILPEALPMLRGFNLIEQMESSKAVIGLNMLTLWKDRGTLQPWIEPLAELIEDGTVQPVVSDAVPFDRAAEAHRIIGERRNVGKVVLIP
jgi:NADPH:quinone reductase-like Zn-dependent oxidoreductase